MKLKRVAAALIPSAFVAIALGSCATPVAPAPAADDENPVVVIEDEVEPPISAVYLVAPIAAGG